MVTVITKRIGIKPKSETLQTAKDARGQYNQAKGYKAGYDQEEADRQLSEGLQRLEFHEIKRPDTTLATTARFK